MAFPASPSNGQVYNEYVYNSSSVVWNKVDPGKYFNIGFIYTQLPGKSTPSEAGWYGTWTNISSTYAGDFFRVDGGDAGAFESGEQSDEIKSHGHDYLLRKLENIVANTGGDKVPPASSATINVSKVTSDFGGVETRPVNQTIRIWERTA